MRNFTIYIQSPTSIPVLGYFRHPVSQSGRHNPCMFTSNFGIVEPLIPIMVSSLATWPIQDNFKNSKEFSPET